MHISPLFIHTVGLIKISFQTNKVILIRGCSLSVVFLSIICCGGGGVGGSHNNVAILHNHIPLK